MNTATSIARHASPGVIPAAGSSTLLGVVAAVLLATVLLLGGGTRNHLLSDLVLQLLSIPALVLGLQRLDWSRLDSATRQLLLLAGLIVALPLVQLAPLPTAMLETLPGRAELIAGQRALGLDVPSFSPWTLDPNATLAALRGMLPAVALLLLIVQLDLAWRRRLLGVVIALALLMVPLGVIQVAQGPDSSLRPHVPTNVLDAVGLFANRNHYAGFLALALALVLASMLFDARRTRRELAANLRMLAWSLAGAMLVFGAVLSRSRAGVGLAVVAGGGALLLAILRRRQQPEAFRWLAGFSLFGTLLAFQFGFLRFADRLLQSGDHRFDVLGSVLAVSSRFGWTGTGVGSFPAAYAAHEPVELVGAKILNHAHNDWAEWWVELGVLLPLVAGLALIWWWQRARELVLSRSLRSPGNAARLMGLASVAMVAAHSLVDYPLRTTAISCVFVLAAALCAQGIEASSRS